MSDLDISQSCDQAAASLEPNSAPEAAITADDLTRCTAIMEEIIKDRSLLLALDEDERRRFLMSTGRVVRPSREELTRMARVKRRQSKRERFLADTKARASTGIRMARTASVFEAPARIEGGVAAVPTAKLRLEKPRHCYVCKNMFDELHFFYDAMCPSCADFNYAKRFQTTPLHGRVALITGARVKIGYHAALILLRAGAQVIVTTRFPHDAAQRFAREVDFASFADRLQVHGLDLRHAPSVEVFARYLGTTLDRLDLLINNAAQTVRRPPGYYRHLLSHEQAEPSQLSEGERHILQNHEALRTALALADGSQRHGAFLPDVAMLSPLVDKTMADQPLRGLGLRASAALSQIPYSLDDANLGREVFPDGALDADLQQVDLRRENSWRLTLAQVPSAEMIEVQLVNAVAPFILCSQLKPLMLRQSSKDRHIVNVSAMEGQFSRRTKTDKHPHTNMAKAALNMMTLTSAPDYVRDGIHMNAVDTGWVTDEDPIEHARRKQEEIDFHPPLDIVDGAARILDPFLHGLISGEHVWGQFLKDYRAVAW